MRRSFFITAFVLITFVITAVPVQGSESGDALPASLTANISDRQAKQSKVIRVPQQMKSIQTALDYAHEGDTVLVSEGIYKGPIMMRDDIVLMGMNAERTIIRGSRRKPVIMGAQGAVLSHFTIEGGYTGVQCENTIMVIENCIIKNNRTGIHCVIALPIIRNNIIFRNNWTGIYCETTRTHRGRVSNNVIAENGYCGVMLAGTSQVLVENNVIYFNKQYGVFTSEGARRSRIVHNIFFGNRTSGNQFSAIDQTNRFNDPNFIKTGPPGHGFWNDGVKEHDEEGKVIGPLKRTFYTAP
ncbi:MAG: right-handed parallel beta-helix repeat-containing protein [Chitinispirillia bacterium]|nr:right-handed parallel beta-helix repeat-containing protein [Chitinispirillia bacterium]